MPGLKSRKIGDDTERRVWYDLLSKGFIASKWHNNVDLEKNMICIAKPGRFKRTTTGFPDFIYFKIEDKIEREIIGLEVKTNGGLSKIEKQKCEWYLKNNVFSKIQIASRIKEKGRIKIVYSDDVNERRCENEQKRK